MKYKIFTVWLTISFVFFTFEYFTEWLKVVTLGGLVAGSFIMGSVITALTYFVKSRTITYLVTLAALWSMARIMPGYTLDENYAHLIVVVMVLPELCGIMCQWLGLASGKWNLGAFRQVRNEAGAQRNKNRKHKNKFL